MKTIKLKFPNQDGEQLSAKLELPTDRRVRAYAIFAHCFTCSKNLIAVTHISRGLTSKGIAVLRFDFTGLGESEGEFEDTNFSSNVQDLIVAAEYLEENYGPAKMLVGHSLGGAAVLMAAAKLKNIEAVTTIGAPSDPVHVKHLFQESIDEIKEQGEATVSLGGRPFTIKKQFVDDLAEYEKSDVIKTLKKPLLIMHSPQDDTVDVSNAEKIYTSAMHPKSFISLDGADHLLSKSEDAQYAGEVIAAWAARYVSFEEVRALETDEQVVVRNEVHRGLQTEIMANGHFILADEPKDVGGTNLGGTPYDLLVSSLGACTAMTIRMYAKHKKWPLDEVKVHLSREKRHSEDAEDLGEHSKIEVIDRYVELSGDLTEEQRERILEIADKCPVHKTLTNGLTVHTKLK
ncbi:bifunctional alpha/beta hydrolase/OsmC family protein [uncultured Roseivirga sp.]|uniref:bifunctional alpha/beta hydrolase/OsmC family protein n=1 Tax=uncultured Roseivirga sp. TaxID=543088 RepID=UPI000D7A91D0|nr:bifunctional alpha/beta hydrolase/OsmC family protein [uncultured Roseivirga sp.]PWL30674.1 MAG: osmotically inducible protein C [Roseivirga sp. XM-24bin3]